MDAEPILAVRRGQDDGKARLIISHGVDAADQEGASSKLTVVCSPESADSVLQTFVFDIIELGDESVGHRAQSHQQAVRAAAGGAAASTERCIALAAHATDASRDVITPRERDRDRRGSIESP